MSDVGTVDLEEFALERANKKEPLGSIRTGRLTLIIDHILSVFGAGREMGRSNGESSCNGGVG